MLGNLVGGSEKKPLPPMGGGKTVNRWRAPLIERRPVPFRQSTTVLLALAVLVLLALRRLPAEIPAT